MIYGSSVPTTNKAVVCEAGFSKMCMLNVDDNPIVANMMTFALFFIELILFLLVVGISQIAGWQQFADKLKQRVAGMLPGFIVSHNMELAFILYLNVNVWEFPMISLAIAKSVGYAILAANLGMTGSCYAGTPKEVAPEAQASDVLKRSITRKKSGVIRSGTTRIGLTG